MHHVTDLVKSRCGRRAKSVYQDAKQEATASDPLNYDWPTTNHRELNALLVESCFAQSTNLARCKDQSQRRSHAHLPMHIHNEQAESLERGAAFSANGTTRATMCTIHALSILSCMESNDASMKLVGIAVLPDQCCLSLTHACLRSCGSCDLTMVVRTLRPT